LSTVAVAVGVDLGEGGRLPLVDLPCCWRSACCSP